MVGSLTAEMFSFSKYFSNEADNAQSRTTSTGNPISEPDENFNDTISSIGTMRRSRSLQNIFEFKQNKEHHSQLFEGKFEVLSVDDDPVNQLVIEGLLEPLGYVVTMAMDGDEALSILRQRDYLPDLVLLDAQMPFKTGYEVCEELRREYPEGLPVIMISANTDEASILKGLQVGCNDYVKKPFNRAELVARVETQLRLRDGWIAEVDAVRSNLLLGQVFPEHIAERLKGGESVVAEAHDCVTILFSDIVGFTRMSTSCNTAEMFDMLNRLYTAFDALVDKHGVFKVDTIGDAYMVAAGHEAMSKDDHYLRCFAMAKDMLKVAESMVAPDGTGIKIRIGMHTGPAYAGVVGIKCPKYTFIGDTVNTASRMESNGFPMCIHVSSHTKVLLEGASEWEDFGHREIKGKGSMITYLAKMGDWENALKAHQSTTAATSLKVQVEGLSSGCTNSIQGEHHLKHCHDACSEAAAQANPSSPNASDKPAHQSFDEAIHQGNRCVLRDQTTVLSDFQDLQNLRRISIPDSSELIACCGRCFKTCGDCALQPSSREEYTCKLLANQKPSPNPESFHNPAHNHNCQKKASPQQTCAGGSDPATIRQSIPADPLVSLVLQESNPELECGLKHGSRISNAERIMANHLERQSELVIAELEKTLFAYSQTVAELVLRLSAISNAPPQPQSSGGGVLPQQSKETESPSDRASRRMHSSDVKVEKSPRAASRNAFEKLAHRLGSPHGRNEVCEVLHFLGLQQYCAAMEREEITTIGALAQMTDADLVSIGVRARGARTAILESSRGMRHLMDRAAALSHGASFPKGCTADAQLKSNLRCVV